MTCHFMYQFTQKRHVIITQVNRKSASYLDISMDISEFWIYLWIYPTQIYPIMDISIDLLDISMDIPKKIYKLYLFINNLRYIILNTGFPRKTYHIIHISRRRYKIGPLVCQGRFEIQKYVYGPHWPRIGKKLGPHPPLK